MGYLKRNDKAYLKFQIRLFPCWIHIKNIKIKRQKYAKFPKREWDIILTFSLQNKPSNLTGEASAGRRLRWSLNSW